MLAESTAIDEVLEASVKELNPSQQPQLTEPRSIQVMPAANLSAPDNLLQVAMSRGADLQTLERLLDAKERWDAMEARKAFNMAMSRFKAEPMQIFKTKHVKYKNTAGTITEYDHASLGDVTRVVCPALARHDLSHAWHTTQVEGGKVRVTCVVTHRQGHSESVSLESAMDSSGGKNAIQSLGSAVSYLQRYTLLAITGMATDEEDDDGAGGKGRDESSAPHDDDTRLAVITAIAKLGSTALKRHYELDTPEADFWAQHGPAARKAAKQADAAAANGNADRGAA